MGDCEVIQVIRTTLLRRGKGDTMADPVRRITQYWTFEGVLLWEYDPHLRAQEATDDRAR